MKNIMNTKYMPLLVLILLMGCASTKEPANPNWIPKTFKDLSYRIPPEWTPVHNQNEVSYSEAGIELHAIRIEMLKKGEKYDHIDVRVNPDLDTFELAERAQNELKNRMNTVKFELLEQRPFKSLERSFFFRSRVRTSQPMWYVVWHIEIPVDDKLYRISLEAERFGHFPSQKKTFAKFLESLKLRTEKKKGT